MSNSRRKFIRNSAVASAGFFIVPRHVIGRGFIAPSDKLRIAGIGAGGKGQSDLSEFSKSPNVSIVALCDVDDRQAVKSRESFPKATYYLSLIHISEPTRQAEISYAVFCLKKK